MKQLYAQVLAVYSERRALIYAALLAEPGRHWNVRELAEQLPGVSVEAVTATLHMLLGEQLMALVPFQRRVTLYLTDEGRTTIAEIVQSWQLAPTTADRRLPSGDGR